MLVVRSYSTSILSASYSTYLLILVFNLSSQSRIQPRIQSIFSASYSIYLLSLVFNLSPQPRIHSIFSTSSSIYLPSLVFNLSSQPLVQSIFPASYSTSRMSFVYVFSNVSLGVSSSVVTIGIKVWAKNLNKRDRSGYKLFIVGLYISNFC